MLDISELGLLDDPFPDLPRLRARRRVSKSGAWPSECIIRAVAADQAGIAE